MDDYNEYCLSVLLLEVVCHHCAGSEGLDSQGDPLRAELMRLCARTGHIEIVEAFGPHVIGRLTPDGVDGLEALAEIDDSMEIRP